VQAWRGRYRWSWVAALTASSRSSAVRDGALIAAIAAFSFIPWLGRLHLFDWDEINFAEAAREMLVTGDYRRVQIGFQPFAEKPPLFMWVQALSMRIFGVGEFAARLPNALVGIITLVGIYIVGRWLFDRRFGLWWALAFGGSLLPNLYFHSGIIDPLFNLLIFAGIVALFAFQSQRQTDEDSPAAGAKPRITWTASHSRSEWALLLVAGVSIGLAVLTKGPVGLLLPGLTWLAVGGRGKGEAGRGKGEAGSGRRMPIVPMIVWVAVAGAVAAPWYVLAAREGVGASTGNFVSAFVARQLELLRTGVAGHTGPWYFHFVVLALGCFPASVFAISALSSRFPPPSSHFPPPSSRSLSVGKRVDLSPNQRDFRLWMILLLVIVVGVFSLVQTKIVHYSSLAYFPITFLAAQALTDIEKTWSPRYWSIAAGGVGLLWAAVFLTLPVAGLMIAYNQLDLVRVVHDPFVRAALAARVGWSPADLVVGGLYLAAVILALATLWRRNTKRFAAILFVATGIIVPLALTRIAPRIERYTQATPIAFYESLRGCRCYIAPLGFKSYAHLFYAQVPPENSARAAGVAADHFEEWLLSGPIDRPAYFVSKIDKADRWRGRSGLQVFGDRDGFVFFRREPAVYTLLPDAVVPPR
jgi:4-amino-4-deoxy-L-arabinose transferase-like glycosyltransferase